MPNKNRNMTNQTKLKGGIDLEFQQSGISIILIFNIPDFEQS